MSPAEHPFPAEREDVVDFGPAMAVADSVLYEGYLLYPYRRSSGKNQVRGQFGVLAPRAWIEAAPSTRDGVAGSAESWWNQTECLLQAGERARIELRLRFLQLVPGCGEGALDQGVARQAGATFTLAGLLDGEHAVPVGSPSGRMLVRAEPVTAPFPLHKLSVRVENTVSDVSARLSRQDALRRSLVSSHLLLGLAAGSFLSLLDCPGWARPAAAACRNVRAFPVLAGPAGTDRLMLSAPIILYDYPQVAPESPGDLFDATEIDEILSLRTLALTDEEKAEARTTDPRAGEIIDRVESMPEEILARLHGAVRSLRPVRGPADATPEDP